MSVFIDRIKGLGRWPLAGLISVFVIVGIMLFISAARWVNTSPSQCASCHPYLTDLWARSTGHSAAKVTCYECHAGHPEAGRSLFHLPAFVRDAFIPEKYMSSAERVESRCVECHQDIPGAETEQKKLIRVNHKAHLAAPIDQHGTEVVLGCVDCHADIAHDKAQEETFRPKMASCFVALCHQKERNRDRCQMCHYQQLVDLRPDAIR